MTGRPIRVLLIGPLPPPMGGTTRHFRTLVRDLASHDGFDTQVIDTSRGDEHARPLSNLSVGLATLWAVLWRIRHVDVVSYHASNRGVLSFGPLILGLCRLARRPLVLRIFGGGFGDHYLAQRPWRRAFIRRLVLSADVVLLQTRRAIEQLRAHANGELVWFSTYIDPPATPPSADQAELPGASRCTRFVFLGHLWKSKGVEVLLESAGSVPAGCSIDVYGPADEYRADEIDARGKGVVRYRGCLTHEEVDARLWDYDCLVLPTYHPNEGYPGVIAEAFAHGIPVIATRWLAIPEVVDASCGLLVEPRNAGEFAAALRRMNGDPALWRRLRDGARAKAAEFGHARWSRVFEEVCLGLAQRDRLRA
jgi:glycosyltransferase involved in cell wall biosynthesis